MRTGEMPQWLPGEERPVPKPLNKDDAHDLANMMNAELGTNDPKRQAHRKYIYDGKETPSAREYECSLERVEDIKAKAAEEPFVDKVNSRILALSAETTIKAGEKIASVITGSDSNLTKEIKDFREFVNYDLSRQFPSEGLRKLKKDA